MDDERTGCQKNIGINITGAVLVEIWNPITKQSDWIPASVRNYVPGDVHEDFQRINVIIKKTGIEINGCHPDCVKQDLPF